MLRRVVMGLGYLEGYGTHPGWPAALVMIAVGFACLTWPAAGLNAGLWFALLCVGAHGRAVDYEREAGDGG
jgi:hypothetical protein